MKRGFAGWQVLSPQTAPGNKSSRKAQELSAKKLIMGIQTVGKSPAIGSSPTVLPNTTVARHGFGSLWFSAGIVLVACLGFLTYRELPHLAPFARQPDTPSNFLLLQVDSQGTDLHVSWNRSATAIIRAQAGLLSITDGDSPPQEVHLDADQLRTGSVLYSSGSNKVQFSIKLFEPNGQSVSDSVLAVGPLRMPPGNSTGSTTSISLATIPPASLDLSPAAAGRLSDVGKAITEVKKEAAPQNLPAAEHNPAGANTLTGNLVPGEVVRQILPNVPNKAKATLHGTLHVRVRVRVDPSGGVANATLDSAGPSRYFARLALQAAQSWKFDPPKSDGRAVGSEWLLRFEFRRTTTRVLPEQAAP